MLLDYISSILTFLKVFLTFKIHISTKFEIRKIKKVNYKENVINTKKL